jgi:hypothetical protein
MVLEGKVAVALKNGVVIQAGDEHKDSHSLVERSVTPSIGAKPTNGISWLYGFTSNSRTFS